MSSSEEEKKFDAICEDTQEFFNKILTKLSMPYALKYTLVHSSKQKQIVKMNKLNEMLSFVTGVDAIVSFNETLFDAVNDDTIREILIVQEIDRLSVDIESGKIRTVKPDMTTFSGIIKKYGWEDVARANKLEELANAQHQDQVADKFLVPDKVQ